VTFSDGRGWFRTTECESIVAQLGAPESQPELHQQILTMSSGLEPTVDRPYMLASDREH
jgi:hypothetical protein